MKLFDRLRIHSKEDFSALIIQFIKFGMVGLSNTAISLAIYYIFVYINRDWYIGGYTVGFVVSVLNSYYWNQKYVFDKTDRGHLKPLLRTFAAYGYTFILSTILLFLIVHYAGISEMAAPIIILIITVPMNFLINKFWTFK